MIIKNQHIKQVLIKSGWYENRAIDTSPYMEWYKKYGFEISDVVIDFLSSFGGLTLQIPCYRYQVRNKFSENNVDFDETIIIEPEFYITPDFSNNDIKESIEYISDICSFFGMKKVFPIGHSKDFWDEYFLGINTELIAVHEGDAVCFGTTFEDSLTRIMTDEFIDMKCIW